MRKVVLTLVVIEKQDSDKVNITIKNNGLDIFRMLGILERAKEMVLDEMREMRQQEKK